MKKSDSIDRPCVKMAGFTSHQLCFLEPLFRLDTQGCIIIMLELMQLVIACLYNMQNDVGYFMRLCNVFMFCVSNNQYLRYITLSRLTSNFCILDKENKPINIGLYFKSASQGKKAVGYSKKSSKGDWEFSLKAVDIIKDFINHFPDFIRLLGQKNIKKRISVYDFNWCKNIDEEVKRMKSWIVDHGIKKIERTNIHNDELKYVKMIENSIDQYAVTYRVLPRKTVVVRGVPRQHLLKPEDSKARLNNQRFSLGDRVVYAANTEPVPFGMKGTVVGIKDRSIGILFDYSFAGGTNLGGRTENT